MKYIVQIDTKEERDAFAAELTKLIGQCETYIPSKRKGQVYRPNIGIKAKIKKKKLTQILGLIDRRGYLVNKIDGPA
tara:strand:- start:151 stop:381 length:231 start_codon:yes stop_codon:yes gene_type:complete